MNPFEADEDSDGVLDGLQTGGARGDPFFAHQWHLHSTGALASPMADATTVAGNDLGVMPVYHRYMGYHGGHPVTVQVVDTGVDYRHSDLKDAIDLNLSRDSIHHTMGSPAESATSDHGTMCSGIIAARAFNGIGVRGVAPFAKLAVSNWLAEQSNDELEAAWTQNDPEGKIAIANNSWGVDWADSDTFYEDLMGYAAEHLRIAEGIPRGKLFVKSAGNGRLRGHDSGLSYMASNRYVITVASLMSDDRYAPYSSPGSNILTSAYAGYAYQNSATIGTTYITGRSALAETLTYNSTKHCYERGSDEACSMPTWPEDTARSYTYGMNGTSAAASMVTGALALVLEACPTLGWRDVRYLIARTATQVDSGNANWVTNGAGLHHSIDYGFGRIIP